MNLPHNTRSVLPTQTTGLQSCSHEYAFMHI